VHIGQPVVFVQAHDEAPWTARNLRRHPALVAAVNEGGTLDLVVLPFGHFGANIYKHMVPQYSERFDSAGGWLHVGS